MYLHLGKEVVVKLDDVVGIFDLEKSSIGKSTKEFLHSSTKSDIVITVSYEMPKSFIVCSRSKENNNKISRDEKRKRKRKLNTINSSVYISQISCSTLQKRISKDS